MMRSALNRLDAHSETTVMIGDRMDTDIISGLEAGLRTILVTTGSTQPHEIEHFPYRPTIVCDSVADLVALVGRGLYVVTRLSGRRTVKVLPTPRSDSSRIDPP